MAEEKLYPFRDEETGKWGYKDEKGNIIIKPQFDWADHFSEGLARIMVGGKYGYINQKKRIVIRAQFDKAESFSWGWARVKKGERYGYINKKGKDIEEIININEMENILIKNPPEEAQGLIKDRVYLFIKEMISQILNDNNADKHEKLTFLIYFFLFHWNTVFRWSRFCFDDLKNWIKENEKNLENFRNKEITNFEEEDANKILEMYDKLLRSLVIGTRQFTGASKTLHILAPKFFPLWDGSISKRFRFNEKNGKEYVEFIKGIKEFLNNKKNKIDQLKENYDNKYGFQKDDKSIVKILDEYLFLRYTKGITGQ